MSTFGKKSLVWWDYKNHERDNVRRFTFTPKDFQLKILEKWYPLGMIMQVPSFGKMHYYKVVGYHDSLQVYNLKLEMIENKNSLLPHFSNYPATRIGAHQKHALPSKTIHPLMIEPIESEIVQIKRDYKIKKLLD
jgi:hypothetical protein